MTIRPLQPVVATLLLAFVLAGCGDDSTEASTGGEDSALTPSAGAPECDFPEDPAGAAKDVQKPPDRAIITESTDAVIKSSLGDLRVELLGSQAPCTVSSFVSLAEQDYFDDTPCHRLTTDGIFVAQCGDPLGLGTGGPGYTIPDEFTGQESYPAGTLAMANTGAPNSGGSQFFIVYEDSSAGLAPAYTVFGTLDDASTSLVRTAAADGTADGSPDGAPKTPISIVDVEVGQP